MATKKVKVKKAKTEFVEVGEVAVDTGQIVIMDPCRIGEIDVEELFIGNGEKNTKEFKNSLRSSTWPKGVPLAVTTTSGVGDGIYPVFAEIIDLGKWGKRVASLHIDFGISELD